MNVNDLLTIIKALGNETNIMSSNVEEAEQQYSVKEDPQLYKINSQGLDKSIFQKAIKVKHARVTDDIYAVINLTDEYAPYKSLLLSLDGNKIISKESTNNIMKKRFKELGASYELLNKCAKLIFKNTVYRLPYVYGKKVYMPTNAIMKKSGTWIALHLVTNYTQDSEYGCTKLQFINKANVLTELTRQSFEKQLERAVCILTVQERSVKLINKELCNIKISTIDRDQHHMINRRMNKDNYKHMDVNFMEYLQLLLFLKILEGYPDEVNNKLEKDFLRTIYGFK